LSLDLLVLFKEKLLHPFASSSFQMSILELPEQPEQQLARLNLDQKTTLEEILGSRYQEKLSDAKRDSRIV
jgi:hypothetical protein